MSRPRDPDNDTPGGSDETPESGTGAAPGRPEDEVAGPGSGSGTAADQPDVETDPGSGATPGDKAPERPDARPEAGEIPDDTLDFVSASGEPADADRDAPGEPPAPDAETASAIRRDAREAGAETVETAADGPAGAQPTAPVTGGGADGPEAGEAAVGPASGPTPRDPAETPDPDGREADRTAAAGDAVGDDGLAPEMRDTADGDPRAPDPGDPGDGDGRLGDDDPHEAEETGRAAAAPLHAARGDAAREAEEADRGELEDIHGGEEEHGGSSIAATMLTVLVALLIGAGLALWGAPKLAPHVPGAVAQYLVPGQAGATDEIEALRADLAAQAERLAAQERRIDDLAGLGDRVAALDDRVAGLEAAPALDAEAVDARIEERIAGQAETLAALSEDLTGLAEDLAAARERIGSVESQVAGMTEALSAGGSGGEAAAPELQAALQSLRARVDGLAGRLPEGALLTRAEAEGFAADERVAALETRAEEIAARIGTLRTDIEGEIERLREARAEEITAAERAMREAARRGAAEALRGRFAAGDAYRSALTELENLTGAAAPGALAAAADTGVATADDLSRDLPEAARAAIRGHELASAEGGTAARVTAWLQSQVAARPVEEREGSGVRATLSRVEARVAEGNLEAALAEAETLPETARTAMGGWLAALETRVEAEAALDSYLADAMSAG